MTRRARERLDEIQRAQRSITERLVANYRDVLACLDPNNPDSPDRSREDVLALAREMVAAAGGFKALAASDRDEQEAVPMPTSAWRVSGLPCKLTIFV